MTYTIGHSTHPLAHFVELLTMHGVRAVADVRSHPYSRFNPQFRRDALIAEAYRRRGERIAYTRAAD